MQAEKWALTKDPEGLERALRAMAASVNVSILAVLARARRKGDGWMYLSEIAEALGEAPGTVAAGLAKLAPLVEERREKGLRYFRTGFTEIRLELDRPKR